MLRRPDSFVSSRFIQCWHASLTIGIYKHHFQFSQVISLLTTIIFILIPIANWSYRDLFDYPASIQNRLVLEVRV